MGTDMEEAGRQVRLVVDERCAGERLDRCLHRFAPSFSRSFWARAARAGAVSVGGRRARPSRACQEGEELVVDLAGLGFPGLTLDPGELGEPVHECADFLAVDKPAGLLTHPAGRIVLRSATVLASMAFGGPLHGCHRLDKYTSGALLLARGPAAAAAAGEAFLSGAVAKTYLALTREVPREDAFEVDQPLDQTGEEHVKLKMLPVEEGKPARTRVRVLERMEAGALLACFPETGRQHQIRAHLDLVGLPIVGDLLYGPGEDWEYFDDLDERKHAAPDGRWHGLHCLRMELPPLMGGEALVVEAPLSGPMRDAVVAWGGDPEPELEGREEGSG